MHAVICRYNENLDWVKDLNISFTIYNKGKKDIDYSFVQSENIRRESETYIRYIIEHYDKLPDALVLLQGNPFNHQPILLKEIKDYQEGTLVSLSDTIKVDNLEGCPCDCSLPLREYTATYLPELQKQYFMFGTGAQYIVPRQAIVNKSKEWWKSIHKSHYLEEKTPWLLERLWIDIFNLIIK